MDVSNAGKSDWPLCGDEIRTAGVCFGSGIRIRHVGKLPSCLNSWAMAGNGFTATAYVAQGQRQLWPTSCPCLPLLGGRPQSPEAFAVMGKRIQVLFLPTFVRWEYALSNVAQ